MKKLSLLLIFGAAIVLFGCQKDSAVNPSEEDQAVPELKADKIYFTGTCGNCNFDYPEDCGEVIELPNGKIKNTGFQSVCHDVTNITVNGEPGDPDPLTTGVTHWMENFLIEADKKSSHAWGKCTLVLDGGLGEWEFSMQGHSIIKEGTDGEIWPICDFDHPLEHAILVGVCKAVGKSGAVKGYVGEWTYTMDTDVSYDWNIEGWYHE